MKWYKPYKTSDIVPVPHLKKKSVLTHLRLFFSTPFWKPLPAQSSYIPLSLSFDSFQKTFSDFLLYIKSWNSSAQFWGTYVMWSQPPIPLFSKGAIYSSCLFLCSHCFLYEMGLHSTLPFQFSASFKFSSRQSLGNLGPHANVGQVTLLLTS